MSETNLNIKGFIQKRIANAFRLLFISTIAIYSSIFILHIVRGQSLALLLGFSCVLYEFAAKNILEEEMKHIFEVFKNLKYPKAFLVKCKNKAMSIKSRKEQVKKKDNTQSRPDRVIVVLHSEQSQYISMGLAQAG